MQKQSIHLTILRRHFAFACIYIYLYNGYSCINAGALSIHRITVFTFSKLTNAIKLKCSIWRVSEKKEKNRIFQQHVEMA